MNEIVKFNFRGDELEVISDNGAAHVVVRRVCEALGLSVAAQLVKLKGDPSICIAMIATQIQGDDQRRDVACLELRSLPLWLATIHPNKVRSDVREKLIAYKRECAEVLAEHFLGRRGGQGAPDDSLRGMIDAQAADISALRAQVDRLISFQIGSVPSTERLRIKDCVRRIAFHHVRLGRSKSIKSATASIYNQIRTCWGGTVRTMRNLPAAFNPFVDVVLNVFEKELDRALNEHVERQQIQMPWPMPHIVPSNRGPTR